MKLSPHYLFLQYTTLCSSRCMSCHLWATPNPVTLPVEVVERIPRFFDPTPLMEIYVTGGEPFLPDNCVDVYLALNRWKPGIALTSATNGLRPDIYLPKVRAIREAGGNLRVICSLNGRPETHDKTRGVPGNYQKTIEMAEGLAEMGALATVNLLHVPGVTQQADIDHATQVAARWGKPLFHSLMLRHMPWFGEEDDGATIPPFDCHSGDVLVILHTGEIVACQEPRPQLVYGNLRDEHEIAPETAARIQQTVRTRGCQPCGCCTVAFTHGARCMT